MTQLKKGATEANINNTLFQARSQGDGHSYMVHNPYSGCTGRVEKHSPYGRAAVLTIRHTKECNCLDVLLKDLCKYADKVVKQKHMYRTRRDDLIVHLKLRMPLPALPDDIRTAVKIRANARVEREIKASADDARSDMELRDVVDEHNGQRLIEQWSDIEAYQDRKIWRDW
ncbi:hypothetical protein F5Y15DRAFT_430615 [Xylariaceae sp. FL0016]|nr:hypothetical protein F5Y15DRAFT_430615 [Xylariaceae sp. FL0016]